MLHVLTLDNPHKEITIRASGSSISRKRGRYRRGAAGAAFAAGFCVVRRLRALTARSGEFAQRWYQPEAQEEPEPVNGRTTVENALFAGRHAVQDSAADAFARARRAFARITPMCFSPAAGRWRSRRATSAATSTAIMPSTSPCAWAEVWLNERWQSFDITNNTRSLNQHLRLATGLDYLDACPVRGTRLGGGEKSC